MQAQNNVIKLGKMGDILIFSTMEPIAKPQNSKPL